MASPAAPSPSTAHRLQRGQYTATLAEFRSGSVTDVLGKLVASAGYEVTIEQHHAWQVQIEVLRAALDPLGRDGTIQFEFLIPRLGKRADVVMLIGQVVFVLEFKVGSTSFDGADIDQVWDYALDLRNFHSTSHAAAIAPILIATAAQPAGFEVEIDAYDSRMTRPLRVGRGQLGAAITRVLDLLPGPWIDIAAWESGHYAPTPTIVEAARALYARHSVADIARHDAGAANLATTSGTLDAIIEQARAESRKVICFVTGVPGAGKTLVGLDVAIRHGKDRGELECVFLSGNGPLVAVLREALARDRVANEASEGRRIRKQDALREVSTFIQNVHHFRDECLKDQGRPPHEHVALFDEAQRAWDLAQTRAFMQRKKNVAGFNQSEPEFLISCLHRHADWAAIVCLVGGGQEINSGEDGISGWIAALARRFPAWTVCFPARLRESEYRCQEALDTLEAATGAQRVRRMDGLHLANSMRSFRSEQVSEFVRLVLELEAGNAADLGAVIFRKFPIVLTRKLAVARQWIRSRARGSERHGLLVSSQAQRLKPHAIDVRAAVDPVQWFLYPRDDVRSSDFLEDAATEFQVQGLELDWTCVVWDADLRHTADGWTHNEFRGNRWIRIRKPQRQRYLENAYRVLLTRARQGMVIVVPEGDPRDPTRDPAFYDPTYDYLRQTGIRDCPTTGTTG